MVIRVGESPTATDRHETKVPNLGQDHARSSISHGTAGVTEAGQWSSDTPGRYLT
jgi:hypothetical protein